MIRINLLPVREARRQAGLRNQGILLGVAAGIGIVACVGLHLSVSTRIAQYKRLIVQKSAELASLDETRKQVERFEAERKEIEQKLDVIAQLEKARTGPVRLMDEIASTIPEPRAALRGGGAEHLEERRLAAIRGAVPEADDGVAYQAASRDLRVLVTPVAVEDEREGWSAGARRLEP